jgi:hypothetical protein
MEVMDKPVEVRRCRFMAMVVPIPPAELLGATRPPGDSCDDGNTLLVVDARGRVDEEAILGKVELPLREAPFGAPEARFLSREISMQPSVMTAVLKYLFFITSVFSDRGRTTPWSF